MPDLMTLEEKSFFLDPSLHGDDPYERKLLANVNGFTDKPHCIYFYYVGLDSGKVDDIRHYYHDNGTVPIEYNDAKNIAQKLANNAALGDHVPPQTGSAFKNMVWRRISYFIFVVDHMKYTTWPTKSIEFNSKDGGLPNHTFYDATEFEVDVPRPIGPPVRRSAFMCINHMKYTNGSPWPTPNASEFFSFSLILKLGNYPEPWKYDPGGTNQGPPVGPPDL